MQRNPDGTYPKGVSGNLAGPGRGYKHMTTKIMEAISKVSDGSGEPDDVAIVRALVQGAKEGDVQKIKLVLNYVDGMPPQAMDVTSQGEQVGTADAIIAAISAAKRG